MIKRTNSLMRWGILVCLLTLVSCGYKFSGGGSLPSGIQTVCVAIFENRSTETGFENSLAGDLTYEMTRNGRKVVADPAEAEAVLTGVVRSVSVETASYTGSQITQERRVVVTADVVFKDVEGQVLWAADGLQGKEAYTADRDDPSVDDRNRKEALATLSRRFAESIYSRLTDDF